MKRWILGSSLLVAALLLGASPACGKPGASGGPAVDGEGGAPDPGSLVALALDSRVGFLLSDLPTELRDDAAAIVLAKPPAFWLERARRQILTMHQRLTYRHYFAILQSGSFRKGQLPLPPPESWSVTLAPEGAKRITVDGQDVVAVGYHFSGTLLSDVNSPNRSDPALDPVGGTWEEKFVLPVDPDLLFQRTGDACIREPFDNAHSVDGENATLFYDDNCKATENGLLNCHQSKGSWPVDCNSALQATVGRVSTSLTFTRLAWSAAVADEVRRAAPAKGGADLAVRAEGLANHRIVYRYFPPGACALVEKCAGAPGWRRLLQFDASLVNAGDKDLKLGDSSSTVWQDHNVFTASACHKHNHFRFYGKFTFGDGRAQTGDKRAFCLLSTTRYANHEASPLAHPFDQCAYQGIAAGWGDDYFAGIDCQWLDVTDVDARAGDVKAALTFVANPDKFLCEGEPVLDRNNDPVFEKTSFVTDDGRAIDRPMCDFRPGWSANNTGSVDATVPTRGGLVTARCTRGEVSALRDCGLSEAPAAPPCTPNAKATLTCTTPSGAPPQVLRVCEASWLLGGIPCASRDSLASVVVGAAPVSLTLTCPPPRDSEERGGKLSLYSGPVFEKDAAQPVTCLVR